jgi:hypothetical protein
LTPADIGLTERDLAEVPQVEDVEYLHVASGLLPSSGGKDDRTPSLREEELPGVHGGAFLGGTPALSRA